MKTINLFSLFLLFIISLTAQDDPVLFSVEDRAVNVSEFEYIYTKNNGDNADYSVESLQEYLDLYLKFKLKVQKAFDMGLDTIQVLQQELESYRKQLANSYLTDKEVINKLVEEAYGRMQKDKKVAHILAQIRGQKSPRDSAAAWNKIIEVKQKLNDGARFEEVAKMNSDDRGSAEGGGVLGYVTAMLPDGFYELESLIYSLKPGEIGGPVVSKLGYHMVQVIEERPARGEMEIGHIFLRKPKDNQDITVKTKIDSIYQALQNGARFDQLARSFSQDNKTNSKGGYIGKLAINQYELDFEETAFSLQNDGDFSKPVESKFGWHIIQRVKKDPKRSLEEMRSILRAKIENDSRNQIAKDRIIIKILAQADFNEYPESYKYFRSLLDSSFLTFRWKTPTKLESKELFAFGDKFVFNTAQFNSFLFKNTRERIRVAYNNTLDGVLRRMYDEFVKESALKYEENNLKEKYPEFRNLMREYEEGILLFEATKMEVWDKAAQDTIGLKQFFDLNRDKFVWEERAEVETITIKSSDQKLVEKIVKKLKKKPFEKVYAKYKSLSTDLLTANQELYTKDQLPEGLQWDLHFMTPITKNATDGTTSFQKVTKIIPPTRKSLKESRGYVIAEYQNYLEKQWVAQLKSEYEVKINQHVFDSLVKK